MKSFPRAIAALATLGLVGVAQAEMIYGLSTDNRLFVFDHATPGTINNTINISNLNAGESILGIDLRPQTGQLFAMSSANRVLSIDLTTGVATPAGPAFSPTLTAGTEYGFDFNPTVDRIRVVSSAGDNRRLNPINGTAVANGPNFVDTSLTYATGGVPRAVGAAYTNPVANAPVGSVRQFIIDSALDTLGEVGSQAGGNASFNGGVVTSVGALGVNTNDLVGFDISGNTGTFFASFTNPTSNLTSLYTINSATGQATLLGAIGAQLTLRDITVVPAPASAALLGLAGIGAVRRRRN